MNQDLFVGPDAAVVRFYSTLTGDERSPGQGGEESEDTHRQRRKGVWRIGWGQNIARPIPRLTSSIFRETPITLLIVY
ncbi:MAG TPA: hypothetical protein VIR01_20795 [Pyrinomonadaceae bacterium]